MEPILGLDLKNFQSFAETELNFAPGLNVIVGPSNLGKSAAIRALKSLVYNAPAIGLVREGAKTFEVKAWFGDGQTIELTKGKNKSEYRWNDALYAKSGASEAPEVIKQAWNIATPDGRQLCFASQHEPPFLLAEPASAVAKVLGDLTNASMLMEAVQQANKLRMAATNDAKARQREADEARDEIMTHAGLATRGKALQTAREALSATQLATQQWADIRALENSHHKLTLEQTELTKLTESSVNLNSLVTQAEEAAVHFSTLFSLNEQYEKLNTEAALVQDDVWHLQDKLEETQNQIQQLLDEAGICPLCEKEI